MSQCAIRAFASKDCTSSRSLLSAIGNFPRIRAQILRILPRVSTRDGTEGNRPFDMQFTEVTKAAMLSAAAKNFATLFNELSL
jgi:hypothetical protein